MPAWQERLSAVVLPTEVTAPVKFAFVVTVLLLRLATAVVEVTTNGGVPTLTVEVIWPVALSVPVAREVAVAAPSTGVVNVGEVAKTNSPVPVSLVITPANW